MSKVEKKEKCYLCNEEKVVITVFDRKLCSKCVAEHEEYRNMVNRLRGVK